MLMSRRQSMFLTFAALLMVLATTIPGASFEVLTRGDSLRAPLASIRQLLWPTRIEQGPMSLPHSAAFISTSGSADAALLSNRFRLAGAADGWFDLPGARADIAPVYEAPLPGKLSVFASDRKTTSLRRYSRVRFPQIYEGIDLVYYVAKSGELQFDFLLAPNADPSRIVIQVPHDGDVYLSGGAARLRQGDAGIRLAAPVAWQTTPNGRQPVKIKFTLEEKSLGFSLGDYDPRLPLVIDPLVVTDSTFLGNISGEDFIQSMTVDAQGNLYLAGITQIEPGVTGPFPSTPGSYVGDAGTPDPCGTNCLFVLKLTPDYQVEYGALLPRLTPMGVKVTAAGEAVVVGRSLAGRFPWTPGVFSADPAGQAFVLKLDAAGAALVYAATFRAEQASAVALRADGAAVVVGTANQPGLPTTPSALKPAYQPNGNTINEDGFVLTVSADGTTLLAGTYLGGLLSDSATAVAVDSQSRVVISGSFRSSDMTGMAGTPVGLGDIYLARLPANLSSVTSQRLIGGAGSDVVSALVPDPQGGFLVAGTTTSKNLPVTAGTFQIRNRGDQTGWVARVDDNFAIRYLTYFGGNFSDGVAALATDAQSNAYLAGTTFSKDIPTTANAFQDETSLGTREGYLAVIDPTGTQLIYGTYLGGEKTYPRFFDALTGAWAVATTQDGHVYVGGSTAAASFPVTGSSLRSGMGGILDAFLVRFEDSALMISSPSGLPQSRANMAYSQQLTAIGGRAPYSWALTGFKMPDGLSLNASGLISGTVDNSQSEDGEYQFTATVHDADGRTANKSFFLAIAYPGNWYCANGLCSIESIVDQQMAFQMPELRTGQPPYTYTMTGALPPGIVLGSSGSLAGAATAAGIFNITVHVTDSTGAVGLLNLQFTVTDPNGSASSSGGGSSGGGSSSGGSSSSGSSSSSSSGGSSSSGSSSGGVGSSSGGVSAGGGGSGGGGAFGAELFVLAALVGLPTSRLWPRASREH